MDNDLTKVTIVTIKTPGYRTHGIWEFIVEQGIIVPYLRYQIGTVHRNDCRFGH